MPKKVNSTKSDNREDFERIPSGIPGLDKLIEGGFVKGSTVLVTGAAGTGKTIFCTQYLMEGLKRGENCMFITLEEKPEDIINDVERFGWDLEKYVKDKKLILEYQDPFQMTDITSPLLDKIKEHGIQRVVVDSTAVFEMYYKEPAEVRKQLFKLLAGLKEIGTTSLLTSELPEESSTLAKFGVEEFIVDTVIILHFLGIGEENYNSLQIRKMRRTNHKKDVFPMEITDKGIVVKQIQY
jgi:circadian clock protein KaiC